MQNRDKPKGIENKSMVSKGEKGREINQEGLAYSTQGHKELDMTE